jgi:Potato inhibitor I family
MPIMKDEEIALPVDQQQPMTNDTTKPMDEDSSTVGSESHSASNDKADEVVKPTKVVAVPTSTKRRLGLWILALFFLTLLVVGVAVGWMKSHEDEEMASSSLSRQQNATNVGVTGTVTSWPELVGKKTDVARAMLETDYPGLEVVVANRTEAKTLKQQGYDPNRVILVTCSGRGVVVTTPMVG